MEPPRLLSALPCEFVWLLFSGQSSPRTKGLRKYISGASELSGSSHIQYVVRDSLNMKTHLNLPRTNFLLHGAEAERLRCELVA